MKALVQTGPTVEPTVEEVTLRTLRPGEVRVQMAAAGVCGTDVAMRDGSLPVLHPSVLGHEAAGIILETAPDVTGLREGDRVVLSWNVPCRECVYCRRNEAELCPHGLDHAFGEPYAELGGTSMWPAMGVGAFAEQTLLPAAAAVLVPDDLPFDVAALLGCGVTTGVGAVLRTARVQPGESVVVIGCGGVGLAAIQGARIAGAGLIIAADRVSAQLEHATRAGATAVVDTSRNELFSTVRELTGGEGADHAIEVVGRSSTIEEAYRTARRGGTVTVVGAGRFDDAASFPALALMADAKTIRGSVYGATDPARDIPDLAKLSLSGELEVAGLVNRHISLAEVPEALEVMAAGQGSARTVVMFDVGS